MQLKAALEDNSPNSTGPSSCSSALWNNSKAMMLDGLLQDLVCFITPQNDIINSASSCFGQEKLPEAMELSVVLEERNLLQSELQKLSDLHSCSTRAEEEDVSKWSQKEKYYQDALAAAKTERKHASHKYQEAAEAAKEYQKRCEDAHTELQFLRSRLQTCNDGTAQVVASLREEIQLLEAQLSQQKTTSSSSERTSSSSDFRQDQKIENLEKNLSTQRSECNMLRTALADMEQMASSRKALADQLAIESQELKEKLKAESNEHRSLLCAKDTEIRTLQSNLSELQELKKSARALEALKTELASSASQCNTLQQKLQAREEQFQAQMNELRDELEQNFAVRLHSLEETLAAAEGHSVELASQLEVSEQSLAEARAMVAISDKKAAASLKDMKRQLLLESKRVDRLQQELQAFLAEHDEEVEGADVQNEAAEHARPTAVLRRLASLPAHAFDEMLMSLGSALPADAPFRRKRSTCSTAGQTVSSIDSPSSSGTPPARLGKSRCRSGSNVLLYKSYSELEELIQSLQKQKAELEERVHHLEQNAACMADELLEKSAIIRSCVSSSSEKAKHSTAARPSSLSLSSILTPPSPGDLLRRMKNDSGPSGETSEVILLQRRVEEGMVKITHLQQTVTDLMSENEHLKSQQAHA